MCPTETMTIPPCCQHDPEQVREAREALRKVLPALASRIFALEGRWIVGSHWIRVKEIGLLLNRVNDFDKPMTPDAMVIYGTIYDSLVIDVERAEAAWENDNG